MPPVLSGPCPMPSSALGLVAGLTSTDSITLFPVLTEAPSLGAEGSCHADDTPSKACERSLSSGHTSRGMPILGRFMPAAQLLYVPVLGPSKGFFALLGEIARSLGLLVPFPPLLLAGCMCWGWATSFLLASISPGVTEAAVGVEGDSPRHLKLSWGCDRAPPSSARGRLLGC